MSNIADFLNEIERLAYKILLWVLLLPKTLLKIILDPNWTPGYVKAELSGESKEAFDNYMSPVVLFLIVTLIPAVFLSFTPTPRMTVSQPQPYTEDSLRDMQFTVDATFISSTARVYHKVWWEVWQVDQVNRAGQPIDIEYGFDDYRSIIYLDENGTPYENPTFTFVYGELHDEVDGETPYYSFSSADEPILSSEPPYPSQIQLLDTHKVEDYFFFPFEEGEYQIRVTAANFDPNNGQLIEWHENIIYATVPADTSQQIYFDSDSMIYDEAVNSTSAAPGVNWDDLQSNLESGGTYLLALGLLSLPLLFSFGTKILGEEGLGGASLKTSFYMQCYYFSPVTAVFWSSVYATTLYTSDINGIALLASFIVFALILIWFLSAEVNAIAVERNVSRGRASGILFMLMFVLASIAFLIFLILNDPDILRRYSISLYPLVALGVFIAYLVKRGRERRLRKQQQALEVEAKV